MSTEIEKDAIWLKKQRNRLALAVAELAKIVTIANFDYPESPKYYIEFEIGMAGNSIVLRVADTETHSTIECIDIWCISSVMYVGFHLDKEALEERAVAFLKDIARMKLCINKYVKLNNNQGEI